MMSHPTSFQQHPSSHMNEHQQQTNNKGRKQNNMKNNDNNSRYYQPTITSAGPLTNNNNEYSMLPPSPNNNTLTIDDLYREVYEKIVSKRKRNQTSKNMSNNNRLYNNQILTDQEQSLRQDNIYYSESIQEKQSLSQQLHKVKDQKNRIRNEIGQIEELLFKIHERKLFLEEQNKKYEKQQNQLKQRLKIVEEKIFHFEQKNNIDNVIIDNNQLMNSETYLDNNKQQNENGSSDDAFDDSQSFEESFEDDDTWSFTSGGSDLSNISRQSLPVNIHNRSNSVVSNSSQNSNFTATRKHRAYHHHTFDDVVFSTQYRTRSASFNFRQSSSPRGNSLIRRRVLKELSKTEYPFDLSECTLKGHTKSVTSIHLIGSRFVISGGADCTVRVWDLQTKSCLDCLNGHLGWVKSVASDIEQNEEYERLIDDLRFVVSGSGDGTIRLWDISKTEDKCVSVLRGHDGGVSCVKCDSNGVIVSGSVDKTIKIWDRNHEECVQTLHGHEKYVKTLQFKSYALLTGGGDKCVRLWDIRSGKCHRKINTNDPVNVLQFSDDKIIAGCQNGQIRVYDLTSGRVSDCLTSHSGPIAGMKYIGSRLIFSSTVPLLSALSKSENSKFYEKQKHSCFNPIEYNLDTKQTVREFYGHIGSVNSIDFSSTKLVTASTDHTIKAWNINGIF
ncbi:hypothetical protein ABK040_016746 [Willaertia magna]